MRLASVVALVVVGAAAGSVATRVAVGPWLVDLKLYAGLLVPFYLVQLSSDVDDARRRLGDSAFGAVGIGVARAERVAAPKAFAATHES